ncbi:hypothetical protein GOP47_0011532 [Adiantum capillus-veneris]|uniref:Uncharacterized protein n=1 Tax=Adiantum capillus-veneris TaxID=13818 RepID=A0A9D4USZ5_ADICA|nr:hypothetical protein GOP47_0011532 [Adiantum capillus-veneris]
METTTCPRGNGAQNDTIESLHHTQPPQSKSIFIELKDQQEVATMHEESYQLFRTTGNGAKGETLNANRYLNSLKGPELEILKNPKCSVLPIDKQWPFLLRFPVNSFGINLGLGSQAILWKILASGGHIWWMQVPIIINIVVWSVAVLALILTATTYTLKIIFYFEAVRREFNHPIRINYFFVPWVACILLALGVPPFLGTPIPQNIWILFVAPIFALNLKVYGEWISGGEGRLCKIANPSTHLSLLGNFVGAFLIATMGYNELALFFWSVGFFHYLILLVTLYQRLISAAMLPKELHPIYFLFVALPSNASVSWARIMGRFDLVAKIIYFFAVFLFFALVARAKIFYGFRFNIAWWSYTLPLTIFTMATIQYSLEVKHPLTQIFARLLTILSSMIVLSLGVMTILHTFVWKSMFPNDMAIALQSSGIKAKRRIKELKEDILPL